MDWKEISSSPKLTRTEYFQGAQRGALSSDFLLGSAATPRARIN